MIANWKTYELRQLVEIDLDRIPIDVSQEYEMVGVYSFGRGLFNKEPVHGSVTSYKYFYQLHPHHIVMSQLFGWEGALALSSDDFSGKYVSTQFPTFRVQPDKLNRTYFGWWLRRPEFWQELKTRSRGMGDRRRTLNPEALLVSFINIPSLEEQKQIAAKIDALASKIEEAKRLRAEIQSDMEALLVAMAHRADLSEDEKKKQGWQKTKLGEVLTQVSDPVIVEPGQEYPHFGIYGFARGLFKKAPLHGDEIKATKLYRAHAGQFIYSRLKAFEGAYGTVKKNLDEHFVSNEFPTFNCDEEKITPEFLFAYFKSRETWRKFAVHSKGIGSRRERLKPVDFLARSIWLPPMTWQEKIKQISKNLEALKQDQLQAGIELDALLPSILDKAFKGELVKPVKRPVTAPHINIPQLVADAPLIAPWLDRMQKSQRPTTETYLQKHFFAGQSHYELPVSSPYLPQTHGPWSKELTHDVIEWGIKQNWYQWDETGEHKQLVPGPAFSEAMAAAKKNFSNSIPIITALVDDLKNFKTSGLERWMTILMAFDTLKKDEQPLTRESIQTVIDHWPGKRDKDNFTKAKVDETITKMIKRGWIKLDNQ